MSVWTDKPFVPRGGLLAWYSADAAASGSFVPDLSGNGRDLTSGPTPPVLTPNFINGQPALIFNDPASDPLKFISGNIPFRHVFVIGGYSNAIFKPGGPTIGLLSGINTFEILVGFPAQTRFFDFNYASGGDYKYRRRRVDFPESNQQAAMNGVISVFEASRDVNLTLDGIQFGQQRQIDGSKWAGPFVESFIYNRVLAEFERQQIYEYLSIKYGLWPQTAAGLNVWPFQPDWGGAAETDRLVLRSTLPSGRIIARSKSPAKSGFDLQFGGRWQQEYDAAVAFWKEHYPGTTIAFRDDSVSPGVETQVKIVSPITKTVRGFNNIDYSLHFVEV